jgi:signal transduction histidine kinase
LLSGVSVGLFGGIFNIPEIVHATGIYPVGNMINLLYSSLVVYAIIRYRLMEIHVFLKKGTIYLTVFALAFAVLFFILYFSLDILGVNNLFLSLILTIFVFVLLRLYSKIHSSMMGVFFSEKSASITGIEQLGNQILSRTGWDMNNLIKDILTKLSEILDVSGGCIFLLEAGGKKYDIVYAVSCGSNSEKIASIPKYSPLIDILLAGRVPIVKEELEIKASFGSSEQSEKEKLLAAAAQLDEFGIAVCIPLMRHEIIGMFNLGPKKSGKVFSTQELNKLATLGNQIAIALENAKLMEELRHKAEELTRSNKELEQFAYIASHDLQEPLRSVSGYLQLLERRYKDKLDTDAERFITRAVDASFRMQTQINDLLAYSRVDSRGKPFEPTDCTSVVDRVVANLQAAIDISGAVVAYNSLPTIMADASQMAQLFQNLIGNAIKFRNDKPPEIHIGAERKNGEWLFSVCDNGIGIDPQYSERIFQVFQRLHSSTEYPGTGIGLAICKKVVERHGGRIWVESSPGKGSTFFFTIPET